MCVFFQYGGIVMNYETDINTPETFEEHFYLDYFNNYLSVSLIAEHYLMTESAALMYLQIGRRFNHNRIYGGATS